MLANETLSPDRLLSALDDLGLGLLYHDLAQLSPDEQERVLNDLRDYFQEKSV